MLNYLHQCFIKNKYLLWNSNPKETQVLQAQDSNICQLNYPTCEAKWYYISDKSFRNKVHNLKVICDWNFQVEQSRNAEGSMPVV